MIQAGGGPISRATLRPGIKSTWNEEYNKSQASVSSDTTLQGSGIAVQPRFADQAGIEILRFSSLF